MNNITKINIFLIILVILSGFYLAKKGAFSTQTITNEEFSMIEITDKGGKIFKNSVFLKSISKHPFGFENIREFIPRKKMMKLLTKLDKYTKIYKKKEFPHINALEKVFPTTYYSLLLMFQLLIKDKDVVKKKGKYKGPPKEQVGSGPR